MATYWHIHEIGAFLDQWQTLIGSLIGGLLGLFAAWIVAHRVERRMDVSAAMHLVAKSVAFRTAMNQLRRISRETTFTSPEEEAQWMAERLVWRRPKLSQVFDEARLRIMPIEPNAAAHLEFLHFHYLDIEEKLERIARDMKTLQETRGIRRAEHHTIADAVSATGAFVFAAEHAICAEHLLTHHVLSRWAWLNRMRPRFWLHPDTKRSYEMLTNPEAD